LHRNGYGNNGGRLSDILQAVGTQGKIMGMFMSIPIIDIIIISLWIILSTGKNTLFLFKDNVSTPCPTSKDDTALDRQDAD
jgi:hypothetical protein